MALRGTPKCLATCPGATPAARAARMALRLASCTGCNGSAALEPWRRFAGLTGLWTKRSSVEAAASIACFSSGRAWRLPALGHALLQFLHHILQQPCQVGVRQADELRSRSLHRWRSAARRETWGHARTGRGFGMKIDAVA